MVTFLFGSGFLYLPESSHMYVNIVSTIPLVMCPTVYRGSSEAATTPVTKLTHILLNPTGCWHFSTLTNFMEGCGKKSPLQGRACGVSSVIYSRDSP